MGEIKFKQNENLGEESHPDSSWQHVHGTACAELGPNDIPSRSDREEAPLAERRYI